MTQKTDILFVIVIYKKHLLESESYRSFLSEEKVKALYVYDNSPNRQEINFPEVIYNHDSRNLGLSRAYNTAAKYARDRGYSWIILLDQDSDFSSITISDYINAINYTPNIRLFAPLVQSGEKFMSPSKVHHKHSTLQNSVPTGIVNLREYSPINSGMCINVDAFFECGGYNENVPLDYSDFQFVERFRRHYQFAYIIDKVVKQDFSVFSDDEASTLKRYAIFCRCLKGCERSSLSDNFWYFFTVLKRGTSICLRLRTLKPYQILWTQYIWTIR